MLLGRLIRQAMHAQGPFADSLARRDPALAARIDAEAERLGLDRRGFVADAVRRFLAAEDGESWTTIVGAIQRDEDPGLGFLDAVMRLRLAHRCES